MIDIEELTKDDKLRDVIFEDEFVKRRGHICSWNDRFIFVDYGISIGASGIATDPENLYFA